MDHQQRQYEEFQPSTEWVQDKGHQTLIVYLPGFRKEQLKVQVTSARNMRISGERPLGNHKWSRFREECAIPSDCDINAISARFEGGMLHVKLPKKISPEAEEAKPTTEAPKEPAKTTQQENKGQEPPKPDLPHPQPKPVASATRKEPQPQPKPVASATRKEDKQEDEKVNGNAKSKASDVSQKDEEKKTANEKSSFEAEKKKEKSEDGLAEAGKLASASSGKVQPGKLKKTATDLAMGLKRPKALMNLVLGVLLAVVFVLYVTNAFKSLGMPKNTTD